ncbi:MAG: hypothetical protein M3Y32_09730 [Pseudomonadota bacterium]|nr:hypothetical protein [Pseudomonadota bacterium]
MKPGLVWALVAAALAIAAATQGWRGVLLIVTLVVFWLLWQINRLSRTMRRLAARPLGVVPNAVMFNAKLSVGLPMAELLSLSNSLGRAVDTGAAIERFVWTDPGGDRVQVDLQDGRVQAWELQRTDDRPP